MSDHRFFSSVFFYNITLYVLIIRQHMRGNSNVWTGFITETDFAAAGPNSAGYSNKAPEAGFAPQYQAPAVAPVYPTQQYQGAPPHQATSPHPQVWSGATFTWRTSPHLPFPSCFISVWIIPLDLDYVDLLVLRIPLQRFSHVLPLHWWPIWAHRMFYCTFLVTYPNYELPCKKKVFQSGNEDKAKAENFASRS